MAANNAKMRPQNATNAVYTPNGVFDATILTDYNQIQGDALFKLTANFPGPDTYQALQVNKAILGHKFESSAPQYISDNSVTFEFFTTNNMRIRDMTIDLPILVALRESMIGGLNLDGTPGSIPTATATTNKYIIPPASWKGYNVPYCALSRFFNKFTVKLGAQVDIGNTFASEGLGLAINMMEHMVGMGSIEEYQKDICGDSISYKNLYNISDSDYVKIKRDKGDPRAYDYTDQTIGFGTNPTKFLKNFDHLLSKETTTLPFTEASSGIWTTRLRLPLSCFVSVFQGDFFLPPGVKFNITIELPIFTRTPVYPLSAANYNTWKSYGRWNSLAKPSKLYRAIWDAEAKAIGSEVVVPGDDTFLKGANLGDIKSGIIMTMDRERTAFVNYVGMTITDKIASDLANIRLYRPMVLNNEVISIYYEDFNKDSTIFQAQIKPVANLPQEWFIGFTNTADGVASYFQYAYSNNDAQKVFTSDERDFNDDSVFINRAFNYANDPIYAPIRKLEVNFGNVPNLEFSEEAFTTTYQAKVLGPRVYTGAQIKNLGIHPITVFQNQVLTNNYLDRTLNNSQKLLYDDFKKSLEIKSGCPEACSWMRGVFVPDSIQRGGSTSDMAAHIINVKIVFDTDSPYYNAFKSACGPSAKFVFIRKTLSQFSLDSAGNVNIVDWPAIMISGNSPGQTERVTGNPPNGAFQ